MSVQEKKPTRTVQIVRSSKYRRICLHLYLYLSHFSAYYCLLFLYLFLGIFHDQRDISGTGTKKDNCFEDLKVNASADTTIRANAQYFAVHFFFSFSLPANSRKINRLFIRNIS